REKTSGVRCGEVKQHRPKHDAPLVTAAAAPKVPEGDEPPALLDKPKRTGDTPADAKPSPSPSAPRAPVALFELPEPQRDPLLPVPRRSNADKGNGRSLVIAGGVGLGVGLPLAAVAAYAGGRALRAYREGVDLHNDVQGPPDD